MTTAGPFDTWSSIPAAHSRQYRQHIVVNTGSWLDGRKVLLAPPAPGMLDWEQRVLNVSLTCTQVEDSPGIETGEPVSRQWETEIHDYYGWP